MILWIIDDNFEDYKPTWRDACSIDTIVNNDGRYLLDLCKYSNIFIWNGRCGADRNIGDFTCKNVSVIDYCISNVDLFLFYRIFILCPSRLSYLMYIMQWLLSYKKEKIVDDYVYNNVNNEPNIEVACKWNDDQNDDYHKAVSDRIDHIDTIVDSRGVARPWTMWKHNRQGVWGRLGPQWVQGKALVGGPRGRSPPAENGFQANRRPIRMHFWGCFGCSKAVFISEFTEYFIENFISFFNSQTPINFRIRPLSQITLTLVYDRCRSMKGSNSFHRFILQTINTMQVEQTRYCILMHYLPRCLAYINL